MTEASARAREILDAIERDAENRRAALDAPPSVSSVTGTPSGLPPMPAVTSPLAPASSGLRTPEHELPAALRAHVVSPAVAAAVTSPPAEHATPEPHPDPVALEAGRLLALVDEVVEQTKHAQQRLYALDAAVTALSHRLGLEEEVDRGAAAGHADDGAQALRSPAVGDRPRDLDADPHARAAPLTDPSAGQAPAPPASPRTDGARLVAIEMAVGGFSRGEVQDRLAREYGLRDSGTILDDVFGAGSDAGSRMPWGIV